MFGAIIHRSVPVADDIELGKWLRKTMATDEVLIQNLGNMLVRLDGVAPLVVTDVEDKATDGGAVGFESLAE